ncbi:MAG: hypothetical protein JWN04_37 [Myxococcaceae bacterium]|nr:hypothetical protein [Myxococcaceae bacterium]
MKDQVTPWTDAQRRILLNLWCRVARADGFVADAEIDRLSQLFYRLGDDLVSADEVMRWLDDGPPEITELLPADAAPVFLEHAREIMLADLEVTPPESDLVRELLSTYFRAA